MVPVRQQNNKTSKTCKTSKNSKTSMKRKLSKISKLNKMFLPRFQNPFNKENKSKSSTRKKQFQKTIFYINLLDIYKAHYNHNKAL